MVKENNFFHKFIWILISVLIAASNIVNILIIPAKFDALQNIILPFDVMPAAVAACPIHGFNNRILP